MMPVLVVLTPFVAAAAGLVVGRNRLLAQRVAVVGTGIALALSIGMGVMVWVGGPSVDEWGTVPTGWVPVTIATRADGLGATLAIMVTSVALCVQIYSTAYMHREPRYGTFAALVSLFTAAMLLVVLADDLIVLLVGWEVMGICSALLIGHHWEREEARSASVKAFVVTRLGDVGLLAGILPEAVDAAGYIYVWRKGVLDWGDEGGASASPGTGPSLPAALRRS